MAAVSDERSVRVKGKMVIVASLGGVMVSGPVFTIPHTGVNRMGRTTYVCDAALTKDADLDTTNVTIGALRVAGSGIPWF